MAFLFATSRPASIILFKAGHCLAYSIVVALEPLGLI